MVIAAGDRPEPRPAGTTRLDSGVLVSVDATGTVDVRSGDGVTRFETGDCAGILAGAGHLAVCGGSNGSCLVLDCRGGDVRRVGRVTGAFSRVTAAGVCVGHSVVVTGDEAGAASSGTRRLLSASTRRAPTAPSSTSCSRTRRATSPSSPLHRSSSSTPTVARSRAEFTPSLAPFVACDDAVAVSMNGALLRAQRCSTMSTVSSALSASHARRATTRRFACRAARATS